MSTTKPILRKRIKLGCSSCHCDGWVDRGPYEEKCLACDGTGTVWMNINQDARALIESTRTVYPTYDIKTLEFRAACIADEAGDSAVYGWHVAEALRTGAQPE